ncbi:MAG: hypothetical protein KDC33_12935 [Thermoleophilia bacterium]|nr:hypothetical protein [Thermoleophilia bacterium]
MSARTPTRLPLAALVAAAAGVAAAWGVLVVPGHAAVLAAAILLVGGFLVMAPCAMQMALTMSVVVERTHARTDRDIARTAGRFALGYVGFYVPFAAALGGLALALGDAAWIAVMAGALVALVLGLAALGRLPGGPLTRCRGPLWLLRTGRASFGHPLRAGVAFAQYCATCCGPYVFGLAVLAGGTRSFLTGAGLVLAYATMMALPFVGPVLVGPQRYRSLNDAVGRVGPALERSTGMVLVGLSLALIPTAIAQAVA